MIETDSVPIRKPLDLRAGSVVLLLCMVWGVQQVAMKSVAADVPPLMQLTVRFAGAALFFGAWVFLREGRRAFGDGTLPSGLLLGLMFSFEFVFAGSALDHTTAAHTIVLLYSAPIFTALGLQYLPEERLDGVQWTGIAIALAGIVVAFVDRGSRPINQLLFGDLLAVSGGIVWGLSNVVLRRGRIGNAAAAKTVLYQVGVAALVLPAFAWQSGQIRLVPTVSAVLELLFQTLVISIASYFVWFWLLRHYLTSRLMLLTPLTPLFGVMFGALLLREPIESGFAMGSLLVLAGILVVNLRPLRKAAS